MAGLRDESIEDSFEPKFVEQPSAGCGFINPENFLEETFSSFESEEFQKAHVLTCIFCQEKIAKFVESKQN